MLAVALPDSQIIAKKRRTISNQQIEETIYRIRWTPALEERIGAVAELTWAPLSGLSALPLSGPHRKWVEEIRTKS
jgi:hypothetical protein